MAKITIESKTENGQIVTNIGGEGYKPIKNLKEKYIQNISIGNVLNDHDFVLKRNIEYVRSTIN